MLPTGTFEFASTARPRAAVPPKLSKRRIVLRIGPEFGIPGNQVNGFGLRRTIPPWKFGLNSLRITVPESKRSMKLRRWTDPTSAGTEKVDGGGKGNPRGWDEVFYGWGVVFDWGRGARARRHGAAA